MAQVQEPASKRQLWALFCITKKNYQNENLSRDEASKLIKEFNEKSGYKKTPKNSKHFENELFSFLKEHNDSLLKKMKSITKEVSIIEDDPMFTTKENRKQYVFLGGGCGFSFLKFDRRSKKGKKISEAFGKIKPKFFDWFIKTNFTKKELDYFTQLGTPLQAVIHQDLSFNSAVTNICAKYMEKNGVKNVWVQNMYD
jgi:hypothetical protein